MEIGVKEIPSRYLLVDDVLVWDDRRPDGSRLYSMWVRELGKWERYPPSEIMGVIILGVQIDDVQACEIICASEVARTGCAFNGDTPDQEPANEIES